MQTPVLIVSLHDVSPLTQTRCMEILGDLRAVGVAATSLLVIPNHHGKAPLDAHPACAAWLLDRAADGDEIVLHGYFHRRVSRGDEGLGERWITRCYTAGEGEFFDLEEGEAVRLLQNGRALFAEVGLPHPTGFIAPAWLLGEAALRAVRREEFLYTTYLNRITRMDGGEEMTQSLVWSARSAWRRVASLAWNRLLFQRLLRTRVLRIGLHPPDWEYPALRRQILALIRRALAHRQSMTYEHWVQAALR